MAEISELAGAAPTPRGAGLARGKVCLVTGGGSGIGRATVLRLAMEGAAGIVVAGRRVAEGEAAAREAAGLGAAAVFVRADVTRAADNAAVVEAAVTRFGGLHLVFANAGFQERRRGVVEQDEETFDRVFDTNVRSVFLGLRHQVPAIQASGGGAIVVNASVSGIRNPNAGLSLYAASKAAAISLMRSAALECAPLGVRINAVAPGRVVTEMMLASGIADMRQVAAGLPLRRMGHPEEVAAAVAWLLSGEAGFIVGHVLCADGGFLAG